MPIFLFFVVFFDIFIGPGLIGDSDFWYDRYVVVFFGLNIRFFGTCTEPMLGKVCQIFSLLSFVSRYVEC